MKQAVEALIRRREGGPARIAGSRPAGGGCIHDARFVALDDGRRFFLKSGASAGDPSAYDIFEREAESLRALGEVGVLPVPRVLGTHLDGVELDDLQHEDLHLDDLHDTGELCPNPPAGAVHGFLLLEAIETGPRPPDFSEDFGRRFAEHHRASTGRSPGSRYGFPHDNYLGATSQPNGWCDSWSDFWRRHRLGHQLDLARRAGLSDVELDSLGDRLLLRLDSLIGDDVPEEPCLLHGDLWGGNYLVRADGRAVWIDPAAYYGQREADLAMTRLFGGFDATFYRAYEREWPLEPESEERLALYELYHLLNHLNLFGRSYRPGCVARLKRLV
ncbi:MAG: fructosamine kinase family protein [Holophagales bacterium]|nr:fructosamine kinase family protein [Holophagales bacterium]